MNENEIGTVVIETAIEIHRNLGPGLLESVYEAVLANQLKKKDFKVETQKPINITYDGQVFDQGFRADIIVNDIVILELKSVEKLSNVHKKQLQTYLRLSNLKLGYLLNFGSALLKDGIVRAVNNL